MNNKLSNLTVNILTYKTNNEILKNCINSISKSVLINIVENSNKFEDAENFKKLDHNINIICTGNNLGYAAGHNYGISKVTTRYVLILNPDFILLDEPFAGIDPIAVEDIQQIIMKLKNNNIGILITDHNVRETLSITDRSYLIFDGAILKSGSSKELAEDSVVRDKYLGKNFKLEKHD